MTAPPLEVVLPPPPVDRTYRALAAEVVAELAPDARLVDSPSGTDPGTHVHLEVGGSQRWAVEAAVLRGLDLKRYLFLCVANSARSQLAEGLARALAPADVTVASAGSEPSSVRPEAVAVLAEQGIDIQTHRSTSVDDVPPDSVDVVITLCAEEVCPAFLGPARRVHWGLPDPAAVEGDGRLDAFRRTRDELRRRLSAIFGTGWPLTRR